MDEKVIISAERLGQTETFTDIAPETLGAIIDHSEISSLHTGDAVFRAGEAFKSAVFILYDGAVEMQRADGETVRQHPGAILGLSNYLDNAPYTATAFCLDACTVLVLPAAAVKQLEAQHPPFANLLNRIIAERIRTRSAAAHMISGAMARPVRSAMKSPLSISRSDITLREAFEIMQSRKIGSLGVMTQRNELFGILTCSGLSEALAIKGAHPDDSVMQAACEVPYTISPDTPLWRAEEIQQNRGVKYLVVVENEAPVGMISQTDILRALITQQNTFLEQVKEVNSLEHLRRLYENIYEVARMARESNRLATQAVRMTSEAHLAIQRRCVELTLDEMQPRPARPFALLVMGSGGRREMLLNPDQDNGIVLSDAPGAVSEEEREWFAGFCDKLNINLDKIGYVLCRGDIMARNPMFQKTLSEWRSQITHLTAYPNQKAARWSNIVFDFDTLYGDENLTYALRDHVLKALQARRQLLEFMVEDDAEGRPPLGWFNRLITADEKGLKGTVDIKRNGLRIIADAARIYALSAGISSTSTRERLQALVRQGILSTELVDSASAAYEELLDMLLAHQIERRQARQVPDKLIRPDTLSPRVRSVLRVSMRAVKRFQDQLQGQFGRSAF